MLLKGAKTRRARNELVEIRAGLSRWHRPARHAAVPRRAAMVDIRLIATPPRVSSSRKSSRRRRFLRHRSSSSSSLWNGFWLARTGVGVGVVATGVGVGATLRGDGRRRDGLALRQRTRVSEDRSNR